MESREIELCFKGERNYIEGPDLFNVLVACCAAVPLQNIRFSAHSFVRTPWCRIFSAESKEALREVGEASARCSFDANDVTKWLVLLPERGDASTGARCAYDESLVVATCRMGLDSIVLDQPSPFTFIETVVSMSKRMHEQLFPEARGKWIFTRIELDVLCDAREHLSLRLGHNLNFRLTQSEVLVKGKKVGDIYFSLVKA